MKKVFQQDAKPVRRLLRNQVKTKKEREKPAGEPAWKKMAFEFRFFKSALRSDLMDNKDWRNVLALIYVSDSSKFLCRVRWTQNGTGEKRPTKISRNVRGQGNGCQSLNLPDRLNTSIKELIQEKQRTCWNMIKETLQNSSDLLLVKHSQQK